MTDEEEIYPCVGICMPDADEAYCIGCGRPWGQPVTDRRQQPMPPSTTDAETKPDTPSA